MLQDEHSSIIKSYGGSLKNTVDTRRKIKVESFRGEIDLLLPSPLRDEEWEDLLEDQYIQELLDGVSTSREVAEKVQHRRQVYGLRGVKQNKAPQVLSEQEAKKPSSRIVALSILVAQEATKEAEVQAFRTDVLGGKLLSLEAVEEWILEQSKSDGQPTWWLEKITLPGTFMHESFEKLSPDAGLVLSNIKPDGYMKYYPDKEPRDQFELRLLLPFSIPTRSLMEYFRFRMLAYGVPGNNEEKKIPTSINGVLERLRLLSEGLAQKYDWMEAEATLFILTGSIPEISQVSSAVLDRPLSALSRIVLTLDPSLSPKEVAEYYRKVREDVIGTRHRELSEKHMQLAIFAATQPEERKWSDKMAEWNRTHPAEWKYEEVANFSHDCLQARRRLLRSE